MASLPIIGLTTYGQNESGQYYLPAVYINAVRRAGGLPLMIPPGEPRLDMILRQMDGLILTGGGDIDPKWYQGHPHSTMYSIDEERDTTEITLARKILNTAIPLLGICRGVQVLNVALGGTLIEHIPDEVEELIEHRLPSRKPTPHTVSIQADTRLASILGQTQISVLSWHHQALRKVAPSLIVSSYAPDQVIEAVEHSTHPWLIGVQWHPELTAETDPLQQKLFDALVQAARKSLRE